MIRSVLSLTVGVLVSALATGAVSVYLLHDVDADRIGQWNRAYLELCVESLLFALLLGIGVALLTGLVRLLLRPRLLQQSLVRPFALGIAVPFLQYLSDFFVRLLRPASGQVGLLVFFAVAVLLCSVLLLRWNQTSGKVSPPGVSA